MFNLLTTFVPTPQAGQAFFTGAFSSADPTQMIAPETLSVPCILMSEKILIDRSWRFPYESTDHMSCATVRVINELIARGIAEEIDPSDQLERERYQQLVGPCLLHFVTEVIEEEGEELTEEAKSLIIKTPLSVCESMTWSIPSFVSPPKPLDLPPPLNTFRRSDISPLLDSLLTYLVAGQLSTRVHDMYGHLSVATHLIREIDLEKKQTDSNEDQRVYEFAVGIVSEMIPRIPIFLTRDGQRSTRMDHPHEKFGFESLDGSLGPDVTQSIRNLEKILDTRSAQAITDLRDRYKTLLVSLQKEKTKFNLPTTRDDLHAQWVRARAELVKDLAFSRDMERLTDVLTIPAALASLYMPVAGAIPLVPWVISKASGRRARRRHADEYPWFFVAEQLGDVGLEIRKSLERDKLL